MMNELQESPARNGENFEYAEVDSNQQYNSKGFTVNSKTILEANERPVTPPPLPPLPPPRVSKVKWAKPTPCLLPTNNPNKSSSEMVTFAQ